MPISGLLPPPLAADAFDPAKLPQQLFLTGDQINADDVADAFLCLLMGAGDACSAPSNRFPPLPT
jgi:hypothetical protein